MATMSAILPLVVLAAVHLAGPHPALASHPQATHGASTLSVPDGAGGQFIAWEDARDGDLDVYLTRVSNSGAPAAGWPIDGVVLCDAPGLQFQPGVYSDGAGGVIVTWLDGRDHSWFLDLYAQRVDASGAIQWTANGVRIIPTDPMTDASAASDGSGGLLVAWVAGLTGAGDISALRIAGDGSIATGWGPAGVVVCNNVDDQMNPVIASDGAGGAVVAWTDLRGAEQHVYGQRVDASGAVQWTANGIQVDPAGGHGVSLLPAGGGDTFAFWASADAAYGQRLNNAGAPQWAASGVTVYPGGGDGQPDGDLLSAPDGLGGAIVAWPASGPGVEGMWSQRVGGAGAIQWGTNGVAIVTLPAGHLPLAIDVVADGSGGGLFAWERRIDVSSGIDTDVYVQRVSAAGSPLLAPNGVNVAATPERQHGPRVAPDGAGGFIVSWHDERSLDEEVFTQRFDAAGATQFPADGLASFNNPGVQVGPLLLQTPDGGTLAVWNEKRSGRYDIRARKLNDDGTPAGPATTVCDAPGNQIVFALVDDGAGGGLVGWTDFALGGQKPCVQRIDGNGTPLWDANGVAVCGAPGNQETPQMIPDGAGGAIVTWTDLRNPIDPDIYAQRINASGVIQWGLNGASVCTASEMQTGPGVAPDGAGGAIIAWNDRRFLTPAIMAQRLDAAGAPQWTVNGVEIANFSFSGWPATVSGAVSDGSGGAIFLLNQLSYTFVTYVPQNALLLQRIDGSGVRQWGTNGSTVCDAIGRLAYERLIGDGTGGAFVAWSDERSSTSDIYAQHVNSGGSAAWNVNGNVVCDAIAWQSLGGITRAPGALLLSWTDYRSGHADVYAQRVDDTGSAVWSTNGVVVSNAIRGQHLATLAPWKSASPERLFVGWTDDRSGNARNVMVQRLDLSGAPQWAGDGVTGTEVALVSAEASAQRVRLVWYSSANVTATVYRRTESASWSALGVASTDGSGQITFEDPDVVPGERYAYRLGIRDGAAEVFARETWVEVPRALELSLEGLRPNPAVRDIAVTFTLPQGDDARIEWLDVTGRRVRMQSLVGLSPGRHTLRLAGAPPAPGVYLLVLTQGDRTVTARGAIIR